MSFAVSLLLFFCCIVIAQKIVVKVSTNGDKEKSRVLKAVAKLEGIDELSMDVKKGTLTVIGIVDPVCIITCLRKKCGICVEIDTIGPPEKPKPKSVCPSPCRFPPCTPCRPPPCPPCSPYPYSNCSEYDSNSCCIH